MRRFSSKRFSLPLVQACCRQGPFAPRALPRFLATTDPSDSRRVPPPGAQRVSQVPCLLFRHVLSPSTPGSPAVAHTHAFTAGTGFIDSERLAAPIGVTRLNRFAFATARAFASQGSTGSVTLPDAWSATCVMGISHGGLLSFHETRQAYPDAPEGRGEQRRHAFAEALLPFLVDPIPFAKRSRATWRALAAVARDCGLSAFYSAALRGPPR